MEKIHLVFAVLTWLFSVLALLVVPLPINILDSKSNVGGSNLRQNKADRVLEPLAQTHTITHSEGDSQKGTNYIESLTKSTFDGPKSAVGLRLFPQFFPANLDQTKKPLTDRLLRFYAKPQEDKSQDAGGVGVEEGVKVGKKGGEGAQLGDGVAPRSGHSDVSGEATGDMDYDGKKSEDGGNKRAKTVGGIVPPTPQTEKTISVPRFQKDYLGNWVYNPWGVTYGQVYRDTRYKEFIDRHKEVDSHPKFYDAKKMPKEKVCNTKVTIYNSPRVMEYLRKPNYHEYISKQPVFFNLRQQIYRDGNSEECHTTSQTHWRTYFECAMMRNMRMDALVPTYPRRQTRADWDYITERGGWFFDDNPTSNWTYTWGDPNPEIW